VGTKEKPKDGMDNMFAARYRPTDLTPNAILLGSPLTRYGHGSKYFFRRTGTILPSRTDLFQPDDGMGVLIRSKALQNPSGAMEDGLVTL
jgi:hypothetical protein